MSICIKSKQGGLDVGNGNPVRINCNIGANSIEQYEYEFRKIDAIVDEGVVPDCFMDLSLEQFERPLYKLLIEKYGFPVGIVPAYLFPANRAITKSDGINLLKRLADEGLSFFTLHLTASLALFEKAKEIRKIPVTSRGGSIVLRQMLAGGENIWLDLLPDIISIAKEYQITISLGSTFRPAGIEEACDEVHLKETELQLEVCKMLQAEGVQVMVENVGHIALDKLKQHCNLLRQCGAPVMPLGPMPTDCAIGKDHIAAAIGASFMGYYDCAHIINCITRSEHSASFFTIEETLEAIRTAKLTAHIIDLSKGINLAKDSKVFSDRALMSSCLADKEKLCTRCGQFCPLQLKRKYGSNN